MQIKGVQRAVRNINQGKGRVGGSGASLNVRGGLSAQLSSEKPGLKGPQDPLMDKSLQAEETAVQRS